VTRWQDLTAAAPWRREGGALAVRMARGGWLLRLVEPEAGGGNDLAWTGQAGHGFSAGAGTRRGGAAAVMVDQLGEPPPPIRGW
jgi:hypothetical protein